VDEIILHDPSQQDRTIIEIEQQNKKGGELGIELADQKQNGSNICVLFRF
jgi:hypothetical protein